MAITIEKCLIINGTVITRGFLEKRIQEQEQYLWELTAKRLTYSNHRYKEIYDSAKGTLIHLNRQLEILNNLKS